MEPQQQPAAQQLTPDRIRQMELMVKQAMGVLLQDDTADLMVQKAKQGDPKQVVAETTTTILSSVWQSAHSAGVDVDPVTSMVAGAQIIGTMSEMLVHAGVIQQEGLPQFVAETCKLATEMHNAAQQQGGGQPAPGGAQPQQPPAPGGMIGGA